MGRDKTPGESNSSEALLLIDNVHTLSGIEKRKDTCRGMGPNKEGCLYISLSPSRSLAMFCLNIYDDENTRNQEPVLLSPS